ncbi:MAG: hypothetical protein BAJATHORv1_130014, partial [Candidatus Thorarchaeota archaeon]
MELIFCSSWAGLGLMRRDRSAFNLLTWSLFSAASQLDIVV